VERICGRGLVQVAVFFLTQRTQRRSGGFLAGLDRESRAISGRRRQFRNSFVRSGGVFLVYEFDYVLGGGSGQKNFGDASLFEGGDVGAGDDSADEDGYVVHAFFL